MVDSGWPDLRADLSFVCSAGSNIFILHSQVRTFGKRMSKTKSVALVRVSHGVFHGFGSLPSDFRCSSRRVFFFVFVCVFVYEACEKYVRLVGLPVHL